MIEVKTGKPLPDSDPFMQKVRAEFKKASRAEKMARHNVTCSNSRDPEDLKLSANLVARFGALAETGKEV
jgi:hypothetical protein